MEANTAVSLDGGHLVLLLVPAPSRGLGVMMRDLREVEKKHGLTGNLCNIKTMGEGIEQARAQQESHGEALGLILFTGFEKMKTTSPPRQSIPQPIPCRLQGRQTFRTPQRGLGDCKS